ncbi:LpqB family beta-propeller domain-containing protein [Streptomyces sp. NPDC001107]
MGADRQGGAGRRPMRAATYAACGAVLLAGCASMPDSGDLRGVDSTPRQDTQVRVFAMPPQDDAQPSDIVSGFLEALTSDDPNYSTARQYLTKTASQTWKPGLSGTVLANGPGIDPNRLGGREGADDLSFTLTGTRVANVDEQQAYSPADGPYDASVHLTRDKKTKQWRIDRLPQGVVMGKSDFQRNYMSVNKYYFASNAAAGTTTQPAAVADPVYVRRRVDPMTQMVRSLLNGPTNWLEHVVRTSFPTGTALKNGTTALAPDDQNKLTVPLNDKARRVGQGQCDEMAAQLLFTLQDLTPAVDQVELQSGDSRLCSLREADAATVRGSVQHPGYLYFIDSKNRLVRMGTGNNSSPKAEPVTGALGEGDKALRSVGVSHDEDKAAAVSADGRELYVASLVSGDSLRPPVVTSHGKSQQDDRLTAPSWDVHGDLWVADRDPGNPRLLLLEQGEGEPLAVKIPELDGRIKDVRVAADGVRIALVVAKGSKKSLLIGRIERRQEATEDRPTVSVLGLHSATPELEDVTAMSWAGDSRLVVVGREQGGLQTMRYAQVDGSTPEGPAPAALSGIKEITAAESDRLPLVADSEDGIVRLPSGGQWQKVTDGAAPVYPG